MRPSSRSSDDADVIRARLRLLLDERAGAAGWLPGGWVPDDGPEGDGLEGDGPGGDGLAGDGLAGDGMEDARPDRDAVSGAGPDEMGRVWAAGALVGPLPPLPVAEGGLPQGIGRHRLPGAAVRLDPGRRGVWSLWLAGALAAVLVVSWTWWQRPHVQPVPATAKSSAPGDAGASASRGTGSPGGSIPTSVPGKSASTAAVLVVSVVGRVQHPGLYTLAPGARVADAITAAGGLLPGADAASVNLAAVVGDGQQIAVGVPGVAGDPGGQPTTTGGGTGGPVDLNRATAADLDGLPGIGPVLAQRIVDYRQQHGPFSAVDQLDDVPGIGPALFAELRKRVTV